MNFMIKLLDPRIGKTVPLPEYQTDSSAGLDLRCMLDAEDRLILRPGDEFLASSGVAIFIERPACMGLVTVRSSLGRKGLMLQNTIGIIDADYQGEILLALRNIGREVIRIEPCERIAQLIFVGLYRATSLEVVTDFPQSKRGSGGFGSTGVL